MGIQTLDYTCPIDQRRLYPVTLLISHLYNFIQRLLGPSYRHAFAVKCMRIRRVILIGLGDSQYYSYELITDHKTTRLELFAP